MCYRIDLELILSTAEAIVEQLKGSMKLPESVQEALGIHIPNGASSADACTDAAAVNADLNAPASPESLHGGQRTCSTSSVEVLSDGDVEARYECHLQFSL
ncbi:hypothetical protein HPB50_018972 [Hyalomma asiaticum]|uniref:Uncharacterized protein n=1 Tax=Hyalomma asiaticum TaxID=266040 RepID=A0ACB7RRM7_HYAAI|nr:hypothetical protein HPB50_018972 [Hyalomma asiaticum]